ncbi:probable LRR receptor-like serine/threonine-protein kinase At3g47570 [Mangifera indica]|uniref:probable LRR receptor-like serine/threonine-protein kinase At3g47570 n=1 Tax=Mangifera indica TaxID=29780 RepID=UPI001CFBE5C8|nr:probable LRR receptor-like serine/threonine-protein kinase At3g47570 [Mangifera indica]
MGNILCIYLFLHYCFMATLAVTAKNLTTDQSALLQFKSHITSDPYSVLAYNWSISNPICNWIGISCGGHHERVTALNLSFMDLGGTISPHLGNLSFLLNLDLSYNNFHGHLPNELGQLRRLRVFSISNNRISGGIPGFIGLLSKLQILKLEYNNLSGTIPDVLFNVTTLEALWSHNNNIQGSISSEIAKLTRLKIFYMAENFLSGSIPWGNIYNCSLLQVFRLGRNSLSGSLPDGLCNRLPKLEWLTLSSNGLSGQLPRSLGNCSEAVAYSFSLNKFTGLIPQNIGNSSKITVLALDRNNLEGEIPEEIGNLQNLQYLSLDSNSLSGVIPTSIFNISTIIRITLAANYLSGYLPSTIGHGVPNLIDLFLGSNELTGTIPTSITNASKLVKLDLAFNSFFGPVPSTFGNLKFLEGLHLGSNNFTTESPTAEWSFLSSLTNCRKLKTLKFYNNPLYGVIPHSIGNLSATLEIFSARNCKIKGSIPTEVGNLHSLISLDLSQNDLNGFIPTTMGNLLNLQGLWLNKNNFLGFIPHELCKLHKIDKLLLNDNMLSGPIPTCMANLTSLRDLQLGSNKFDSSIPPSLWTIQYILQVNLSSNSLRGFLSPGIQSLKVLRELDLSKNLLSGNIPTTLGGLQSLESLSLADNGFEGVIPNTFRALISLVSLDLSNNSLSGEIPKSLEALTYLKNFNVSVNNLQGEIPNKGPFKTFSAQSFLLNHALCGLPRQEVPLCKVDAIKRSKTLIMKYILPSVLPILVTVIVSVVFIRCHYGRKHSSVDRVDSLSLATWRRTSYLEIQQATDNFNQCNLLGVGSFGSVFKGTLFDGTIVAIKVFNLQEDSVLRSFDSECEVLRNIRHRNLIKVLSNCCNIDFKALILEFMPNGSLEKWLYSHNYFLDMLQRLNIMIDVASALEYLHYDYSTPVIHCDLKPQNILLDEDMVAHVSDFSIARLLDEGDSKTQTLTLATMGYMAPEYGSMGIVSTRGDVYSFGILLRETFTRKKPTDEMFDREMSLKNLVEASLPDVVTEVVDANLLRDENGFAAKVNCMLSIMNLALNCSMESPEQRINMKDVLAKLKKIRLQFQRDMQHYFNTLNQTHRFEMAFKLPLKASVELLCFLALASVLWRRHMLQLQHLGSCFGNEKATEQLVVMHSKLVHEQDLRLLILIVSTNRGSSNLYKAGAKLWNLVEREISREIGSAFTQQRCVSPPM